MCNFPFFVKKGLSEPVEVPCGQCIDCRLQKSKQWAVRIMNEAYMHDENCFLTLTYNNQNLPNDMSINKRELQLFMKKFRNHVDRKVRFYACGEYGDQFGRPHYHIIIFNYTCITEEKIKNGDTEFYEYSVSKGGFQNPVYISHDIEDKVWKKGFVKVGEVTFKSAAYVARYAMKKINGAMAIDHYNGKTPEFALMSRMPGIGKGFFEKYKSDFYPKDFFTIKGVRHKPPRYYDDQLKKDNPEMFEIIKERRQEKIDYERPLRRRQKEKHKKLVSKLLIRK